MSASHQRHLIDELPILILYPHSRCNCRCVMCDIWKIDTVAEISPGELERHADDLQGLRVRWVVFSGGEPLMHSDLFRLARRLRELDIRTTLLTTGLLLEKNAAAVADSIDDVIVSLDGPPGVHDRIRRVARAYELLERGVRALHARTAAYPVAARCTVQRANAPHLCATVETARRLGLRSLSFLAADVHSSAFNRPDGWAPERAAEVAPGPEDLPVLEVEIERLIGATRAEPGFVLETPEKLRRILSYFRAVLGLEEPVAPRCNAPWVSAVIETDGTVRPCFFHRPIGTLQQGSLAEVLNGPDAVAFRRALVIADDPTCRRCVCSLHLERTLG